MPSNDNPLAPSDASSSSQPPTAGQQAAPAESSSPILQYSKTLVQGAIHDPLGPSPPFPWPVNPSLTPEQEAVPYRAPPRFYEAYTRLRPVLDAITNGQPAPMSGSDVFKTVLGVSPLMQPLRGIGDIINYFRGTNYPRQPTTPATIVLPAGET
jgi:hypothetical protein